MVSDPLSLKNGQQLKKMSEADIKHYLEEAAVTSYIYKYPTFGEDLIGSTVSITPGQIEDNKKLDQLITRLHQKNLLNVSSYSQTIKVKFPSNTPYKEFLNARLVDVGEGNNDEDVALLKVNAENLPAQNISSHKPSYRENIRIYGYPGIGNETDYQDSLSSLNPSSATGFITREVSRKQGIIYYQTNAHVSRGYSGGPVFNRQNNILGIIIYGESSSSKYKDSQDSEKCLFLSADSIIKICKRNNIHINII